VDSIGFDSIYAYDHLIPFYSDDTNKNIFECFILLSGLAAITKRIKIGQIVTCNSYRNASLVAKMLSTLDIISNARVELGIAAGWYEKEYVAYGYKFPANVSRIKQLDESPNIIKTMWKDICVSFEGKYYRIIEATCNPKPIQ
jgi:alkanesulfonate monooxygenase SsuD/methylene tetrahydromethanopterin reductase-like flavin-dependent oxidoreductase (luciferase family)